MGGVALEIDYSVYGMFFFIWESPLLMSFDTVPLLSLRLAYRSNGMIKCKSALRCCPFNLPELLGNK